MSKKIAKTMKSSNIILIISILTVAVIFSSLNNNQQIEKLTGMQTQNPECPKEKSITRTAVDSSTTASEGNGYKGAKFGKFDSQAKGCYATAGEAASKECESYCTQNPACKPKQDPDPKQSVTAVVFKQKDGTFERKALGGAGKGPTVKELEGSNMAVECKVTIKCACEPKKKPSQEAGSPQPFGGGQQQQIQQSRQEGFFARWLRMLFGLFIFAGPIPKKKGE